jgi:hypothetical protein
MSNLIVILIQIIFLVLALRVIFSFIDNVLEAYRRLRFSPNKNPIWIIKNIFKQGRKIKTNSINTRSAYRNPILSRLWSQLLIKLSGDTPTAERIISQLHRKYPGHTDKWYIEKAIFDLERDKGRY